VARVPPDTVREESVPDRFQPPSAGGKDNPQHGAHGRHQEGIVPLCEPDDRRQEEGRNGSSVS
jgi:hypothetical protein